VSWPRPIRREAEVDILWIDIENASFGDFYGIAKGAKEESGARFNLNASSEILGILRRVAHYLEVIANSRDRSSFSANYHIKRTINRANNQPRASLVVSKSLKITIDDLRHPFRKLRQLRASDQLS
jgi:hypothetical protein